MEKLLACLQILNSGVDLVLNSSMKVRLLDPTNGEVPGSFQLYQILTNKVGAESLMKSSLSVNAFATACDSLDQSYIDSLLPAQ